MSAKPLPVLPNVPASFWTGKPPVQGICPGVRPDGTIASLPQVSLHASRQELLDYFDNSWTLTEVLFSGLASEEAYYRRPYHQLRHPMIFYYGHPVSLYVNKLRVAGVLDSAIRPDLEALFETGVDEMRWDDLHEGEQDIWPALSEVRAYRRDVYTLICNLIETHPSLAPEHMPITQHHPMWALVMGFEHERIHLETSSVLIRELPIEYVRKPNEWPVSKTAKAAARPDTGNPVVEIAAQHVALGKPQDVPTFGWDNEYGHEVKDVAPFACTAQLISNAEFHAFVSAGGYSNAHYWSREGWKWRSFRNTKFPAFWVATGPSGLHQYRLRTTFEIIDMQWDWPVCVNYHEAKAYCAWRGEQDGGEYVYRLPYEAEHHAMRDAANSEHNLNLCMGSESSVTAFPSNSKGLRDVFGNVWQWCEDTFHPLEGFAPHSYYDDFSMPCFDGEHQMILGGSFISTGDEASRYARFHFRPHFFQHAGFRIVRTEASKSDPMSYESAAMLHKYMLMHWGADAEIHDKEIGAQIVLPQAQHLPLACAALITRYATGHGSALDLGCAVGRSAFELARHFDTVTGVDFSHEFIDAANALKKNGEHAYLRKEQGDASTPLVARVDGSIERSRLRFAQGDACDLPKDMQGYDAVLLANVLCRLPDPRACLQRMQGAHALVKPGGILVMTTPLSWLEEYTPKSRWLKGIADIQAVLSQFELLHQEEIPFMIREHRRKYEYIVTQATVWKRRA
jgi:5-histidylcysteine sulfoxide synthase/putative 4-mercaptohistidine N1-methyltranferase